MIAWIPIRVECYSGGRADEVPRRLCIGDERLEVADVVDRWYQGSQDPAAGRAEYFKLRVTDGHIYIVSHDIEQHVWFLVSELGRSTMS